MGNEFNKPKAPKSRKSSAKLAPAAIQTQTVIVNGTGVQENTSTAIVEGGQVSFNTSHYRKGRGLFIILADTNSRTGASNDVDPLTNLIRFLGQDPEEDLILSKNELKHRVMQKLKNAQLRIDQDEDKVYKYVMVFISSHGGNEDEKEYVRMVPGQHVYVSSLMAKFTVEECKGMKDRPCHFVIQDCRGLETNTTEIDATPPIPLNDLPDYVVANKKDMSVLWANVENSAGLRDTDIGSHLIINLCNTIIEDNHASLMDIFYKLRELGEQQGRTVGQGDAAKHYIAIPCFSHFSLKKKFYFA